MGRQSIQSYPDEAQSTLNGATSFAPAGTVSVTGLPVIPQPTLVDGKTLAPPNTGNLFSNPLDFERGYFQSYNFTLEKAFRGRLDSSNWVCWLTCSQNCKQLQHQLRVAGRWCCKPAAVQIRHHRRRELQLARLQR